MKIKSTHFLRLTIFILVLGVLALCIFALPSAWEGGPAEFPLVGYAVILIAIGMYITVIPFFIALWQALKLLNYIDKNTAFSELSVHALRNIKRCAVVISAFYLGGVPLLYPIADADDAPGLIVIGFVIACIPVVFAVFSSILEKLFQSAIDIKSENDLTV